MITKAYLNHKRITKYEIGVLIKYLPGNIPWGSDSMITMFIDNLTLEELANRYNWLIKFRNLTDKYNNIEIIKEG